MKMSLAEQLAAAKERLAQQRPGGLDNQPGHKPQKDGDFKRAHRNRIRGETA